MRLGPDGENVIDLTHTHNSKDYNHPTWGEPFKLTKVGKSKIYIRFVYVRFATIYYLLRRLPISV